MIGRRLRVELTLTWLQDVEVWLGPDATPAEVREAVVEALRGARIVPPEAARGRVDARIVGEVHPGGTPCRRATLIEGGGG